MKSKHILILAFLLFSINSSIAQDITNNSLYYEGFTNKGSWPTGKNSIRELAVKNGKYYFEHKRDDKNWNVTTREIDINTSKDFEIETSFQRISGKKSRAVGLIFGTKDSDNTYHFALSNKQFRVSEKRNGSFTNMKNWTISSSIKTSYYDFNRLKVKKRNNTVSFYINDTFVYSMNFKSFFGKKIGILVYNEQKIAVDYFRVKQASSTVITKNTSDGKSIWKDDFNSNPHHWAISNNEKAELVVKNNRYYFEHKRTNRGWTTSKQIPINTERDFKIESKILKISGIKKNGFGFVFGRKDSDNQYVFTINSNGSYSIDQYKDGKYKALKDWTKSAHIKKGNYAYNTLKVVKEGPWMKFYVNGRYLTLYRFKPFFGNRFGFVVYQNQKIAIHDLDISYLKDNTNPITDNNDDVITTNSKSIFKDNFSSNNNDWAISNTGSMHSEVRSGKYYFEHKRKKAGWSTTKSIYINTNKDFKIESKILKISGISNNGFGFTFGREDSDNQYVFTITSNGSYSIDRYIKGKFKGIKSWTKSSAIKKGNYSYNTLKLIKENNLLKFYVNNSYLYSMNFEKFMGNRFGFVIYKNQKIAIDDVSISYINDRTIIEKNDDIVVSGSTVLEEYFNSNSNNWPSGSTDDKAISISNSFYNFSHKKDKGGWAVNIPKKFDTSRDFEISTKIKKITGVTNYSYGLQWAKEGKSSFRFYITSSGYYKISRVVNDKEEVIKKFTKSSSINTGNGKSNTLKIKKIGDTYKFYVNNTYLTQTDFEPFFGNRVGYVVFNKQKIAVDYLIIKHLSKAKNTVVTSNSLKTPLSENFSSNSNGWDLTDNDNKTTRISEGKLYIKNNIKNGGAFIGKRVDIDTNKDFIIETSVTRRTSDSNGSIAFAFGRKNNTNEFDLFLSKDGSYLFRRLENDKSIKDIPWTNTSALKTSAFQTNKLKIVKSGSLLRFYINDQYVNEAPYIPFYGKYIGFSVYDKQEVSIDYLNVSYPTSNFNTPPQVVITEPIVQRGFKIVKTKKILVRGKATDKDGIYEVIINGIDATIEENGNFTANVPLKIGTNDLIVKATDLKQASSTKTFTIKRKSPVVNNDDVVVINDNVKKNLKFGEYYALLIGVSDYGDGSITSLDGLPTKDAKDLGDILINQYNFKRENVIVLNNSPKANDIIKEFTRLRKRVTKNDNVLVFYAGHGVYDEKTQVGHWLPSDANMEYETNLISNSQVGDFLKRIESKHTLLISDACFSGSIFKKTRNYEKATKSIEKKHALTSRKAITSGTLKTVPNKSVFLKYLLDRLTNNKNRYLSASKLFGRIEEPVMNNSPNTPQYGTIFGIGDEGGDFIFIKK